VGPIGKIGMNRLWPSVWLLGAVLYAAATLVLTQPFLDSGSASLAATHETVVAKQAAKLALDPVTPKLPLLAPAPVIEPEPVQPSTESVARPRNEWVAIVGYTAVIRAGPSVSSPVLTGYPIGHALRVIAREGDFARVQDLSSGHLGWVAAGSIGAFVPGYREREPIPQPTLVAATQSQTSAVLSKPPQPAHSAVPPRPKLETVAVTKQETVAVTETAAPPLLTRASLKPQRLAQNQADGGVAALVQRAFSGH
jgi:hypothetical protein